MIGEIIRDYLDAGNRKLTVPGLGTFMRKDSGEVIFVDLIRKDDGVLRKLIEDSGPHSDIEAMAFVDRFIFEIKRSMDRDGRARIEGLGTMTFDDRGMYLFKPSAGARPEESRPQAPKPAENRPEHHPAPSRPAHSSPPARDERTAPPAGGERAPSQARRPAPIHERQKRPAPKQARGQAPKKSNTGVLLVTIAIIAALIAIVAMIFGLSVNNKLPFIE